jgi:eukaryotic-like serine/threonine-protein kinase
VFTAETTIKLLLDHAHTAPPPPSSRTEMPIPPDLEALVLSCLAKEREHRPQSARELLERLDAVALPQPWTDARARDWWNVHLPQNPA